MQSKFGCGLLSQRDFRRHDCRPHRRRCVSAVAVPGCDLLIIGVGRAVADVDVYSGVIVMSMTALTVRCEQNAYFLLNIEDASAPGAQRFFVGVVSWVAPYW